MIDAEATEAPAADDHSEIDKSADTNDAPLDKADPVATGSSHAPSPSHTPIGNRTVYARARAFMLSAATNEWTDVATGLCCCIGATTANHSGTSNEMGSKKIMSIVIRAEDESNANVASSNEIVNEASASGVVFQTSFGVDQEVMLQQDTVISWTQADGTDAALSFETQAGCRVFWYTLLAFTLSSV